MRPAARAGRLAATLLLLGVTCAGCGSAVGADSARQEVVVLAAASLADVLAPVVQRFEAADPTSRVTVSTGASSTLARQVVAGAPADLLVTADPAALQTVLDAGQAEGPPVVVTRNRLQIAVPAGNPGGVRGLADLARPELAVALCAEPVPCGRASARAFRAAGLQAAPDTLEQDVKAVLTKVRLGEVDAGLVYVTDVRAAAAEVEGIALPAAWAPLQDYPAVVLRGGDSAGAARRLLALLTSAEGQAVLAEAGFAAAPASGSAP